ncbi:MAG: MraY family glycosyltransferase [bacterium]
MLISQHDYFLAFLACFVSSIVFTRLFLTIARSFSVMDHTNERKVHEQPTAYLGGPAVLIGLFLPLYFFAPNHLNTQLFLSCGIVAVIGLLDDLLDLSAVLKLLALFCAVFIATQAGLSSDFFPPTLLGNIFETCLTLIWVVFVISAINASDNMDGLAPGFALIACLMFFIIGAIQFHYPAWALLSISMCGALLGFLLYNFHPSVIFLGDSGSFFIGFFLAMLSVMGKWSTNPLKSVVIPLVILSVPILDLVFVVIYRYATGVTDSIVESIEYSAQDHLSHRIQQVRNFGTRRTVFILYSLAFIVGIIGVIMRNTHPLEAIFGFVLVGFMYGLVILLLLPNLNQIYWRWEAET